MQTKYWRSFEGEKGIEQANLQNFRNSDFLSALVQKLYTKAIKYYIKRRFYCVLRVFCATCI